MIRRLVRRLVQAVVLASVPVGPPAGLSAWAQAPIVATPLPAIDPQAQPEAPPPPPQRAPGWPDTWLPRQGASLQILDKVNARAAVITVQAGGAATYQGLTIALRTCVVRPPDQPADAAAYITVTDKGEGARPVGLWLVRSAPAVSMLQHPIFDLRVMGCTG